MIKVLNFCKLALGKGEKDRVSPHDHFHMIGGNCIAFDGDTVIIAPLKIGLDCSVKGGELIRALKGCSQRTSLALMDDGSLTIKSGSFEACVNGMAGYDITQELPFLRAGMKKAVIADDFDFRNISKKLLPFVSTQKFDRASKYYWSTHAILWGATLIASNNISVIFYTFPEHVRNGQSQAMTLTNKAMKIIAKKAECPVNFVTTTEFSGVGYADGTYVLSRQDVDFSTLPDMSNLVTSTPSFEPIDTRIFSALKALKPSLDKEGRVYFMDGAITSSLTNNHGLRYEMPHFDKSGNYLAGCLAALEGVATHVDFPDSADQVAVFKGESLWGVLTQLQQQEEEVEDNAISDEDIQQFAMTSEHEGFPVQTQQSFSGGETDWDDAIPF